MINKKNLLFIATDLCTGGTEKVLKIILDNLDYSKYNVDLLLFIKAGYYYTKINPNVKIITLYDTSQEFRKSVVDKSIDKALHENIKPKYDIHISFAEGFSAIVASYYGNWAAKKIAWIHRDANMSKEYLLTFKYDYYNMDKIVFVSDGCLHSFIDLMGNEIESKCMVIQNPIDINLILNQAEEHLPYIKERPMLLALGRLGIEKGFHTLINVHKRLLDDGIDNELIILGDGPDFPILLDMIRKLNLTYSAHLLGFMENPYPWIKKCDILVSSSQYESYSLVVAEGMLLKKPIVATNTIGSQGLLQDKYGLLVDNNEDALYEGLKSFLLSKELRDFYVIACENVSLLNKDYSMKEIELLFDE